MSKKKIYIVEDDRLVAADLAGILERSGYTVAGKSTTGEGAIEQVIRLAPDLVLVDIGLEGEIDGVEAARQIRAACDIPVVYVTAYSDRETVERAKITEPFGYVLKPFDERELGVTIEMALYKHQIDRELEKSRQWLQTTLQSIGDAVIATDIDGVIKFINPVAEALTGWSQAEATGRDMMEVFRIVDEKTGQAVENPLEKVLLSGKIVGLANHTILIAQDGRKIPIDDSAAPILDAKGEIGGVVLTFRDVTERVRTASVRRRAEEALRQSEQSYRTLTENIPGTVYRVLCKENGKMVFFNDVVTAITGYTPKELTRGEICSIEPCIHLQDREQVSTVVKRAIKDKAAFEVEYRFIHKNGDIRHFSEIGKPIFDSDGSLFSIDGIIFDVTERVRAEAIRRQAEEALRQRNRELATLYEATTAIRSDLSLDVVLQTVAEQITHTFNSSGCALSLWNREKNHIEMLVDYAPTWPDKIFPVGTIYDLNDYPATCRVLETGELVVIQHNDPEADEAELALMKKWEMLTLLMAPLIARNQVVGILELSHYAQAHEYTPEELRLAESLAAQASITIENARLYTETRRRLQEQIALRKAGMTISSTLELQDVLNHIAEQMGQAIDATSAYFCTFEEEALVSTVVAEYKGPRAWPRERVSDLGVDYAGEDIAFLKFLRTGTSETAYIDGPDLTELEQIEMEQFGARAILYIPLLIRGQILGYAELWESQRRREFTPEEIDLCRGIAQQAAIAIENARLYEQAQQEIAERIRTEAVRRQAEEALRESNRRLEETLTELRDMQEQMVRQERLAAVGQLSAGIAHDFRTLLTTIILYAQMSLRQPGLTPKLARNLDTIIGESDKAAELVQQILDFSGRSVLKIQVLDLQSLVQDVMDILRRIISENVRLSLKVEPGQKSTAFTVQADRGRIQQLLTNLATNARDAMPRGGELGFELSRITVAAGDPPPLANMPYPSSPQVGAWVYLSISDTGIGMTEEVRAHLFEPFFTTKDVDKGTGLGLAQVYGIVRQHYGYIDVETELGQGTIFHIYLPAHVDIDRASVADIDRASVVDSDRASVKETQAEAPPAFSQGQGETILLVEDNDDLRQAGQSLLESLGYRVLAAANGHEALAVYETSDDVDLVITDVVMPEMGGKELVQEMRRSNPSVKVLGITGYTEEQVVEELIEVGFLEVIAKPFDIETLAQAIHRALSASAGRWI